MKLIERFFYSNLDTILDSIIKMLQRLDKYVEAQIAEEEAIEAEEKALAERKATVKEDRAKAERVKENLSVLVK